MYVCMSARFHFINSHVPLLRELNSSLLSSCLHASAVGVLIKGPASSAERYESEASLDLK